MLKNLIRLGIQIANYYRYFYKSVSIFLINNNSNIMFKEKLNTILKLTGGNAFSQVIVIIGMPLLTRLYDPKQFGILAIINSIIMVLGVIGTGRYDQIMYNLRDRCEYIRCYSNGFYIALCISFLVLMGSAFFVSVCNIDVSYLFLGPLIFSFSIYQLYVSLVSISGDYHQIINGNIIRSISLVLSQYFLSSFGAVGLATGLLVSQVLPLLFIICFYHSKNDCKLISRPNYSDLKLAAFSSAQSLANSISSQLPVAFIPMFFGMTALGYYSLAIRLTQLPITFFSNAIRPFILGELSKYKDDLQSTARVVTLGSTVLLGFGILGIILINLFATDFFRFYAGAAWVESGEIASALSFWLLIAFANIIAVSHLTVSAKFSVLFWYDFLLLNSRVAVVFFCHFFSVSFMSSIYFYSLIGMIFNLFIIIYSIYLGKKNA